MKDCTLRLMELAKGEGTTVFVIGHVNKEGSIAGPKVLNTWWTAFSISRGTST